MEFLANIDSTQEQAFGSIVFIESSIADYQSLIPNIKTSNIIILDSTRDGIEQITEELAQRNHVTDIHIISHGQSGNVQLGTAHIT